MEELVASTASTLNISSISASGRRKVLENVIENIKSLDPLALDTLLKSNPYFDVCQTFPARPTGILKEFNFAQDAELEQCFYLLCFDHVSNPDSCEKIAELICLLQARHFKYTKRVKYAKKSFDTDDIIYNILRKITSVMKERDEKYLPRYQLLLDLVRDHSRSWFETFVDWEKTLWTIDIFIAVELLEHERVATLLKEKKSDISRLELIGPVFEEGEICGPPMFVSYPARWLALMSGDLRMMQLMFLKKSPRLEDLGQRRLLMLKFYRKQLPQECHAFVASGWGDSRSGDDFWNSQYVFAARLIAAAERRDHQSISDTLTHDSNFGQIYQHLGKMFLTGSCKRVTGFQENVGMRVCQRNMGSPEQQNKKSLMTIAIENCDIDLLDILLKKGVLPYDVDITADKWNALTLFSGVIYGAVKRSLSSEDKVTLDSLFLTERQREREKEQEIEKEREELGLFVAPMVLYHAAHQGDIQLLTTLTDIYGIQLMHLKPEGGKTCHQLSLLDFKECDRVHRVEVQNTLLRFLNESSVLNISSAPAESEAISLSISELMRLSEEDLKRVLDASDFTEVVTEEGKMPLIIAFLKNSTIPYNFEFFCTIKNSLKTKDNTVLSKHSSSILAHVIENADPKFVASFLLDDDVRMDMRNCNLSVEHMDMSRNPIYLFRKRLDLIHCVSSFLDLYEGDLALSCFLDGEDKATQHLVIFYGKEELEITKFEEAALNSLLEWFENRSDNMLALSDILADNCVGFPKHLIFDYIQAKKPQLLTSTNELGMNLLMYCADTSVHFCDVKFIKDLLQSQMFNINEVARVSDKEDAFKLQHILGKARAGKLRNSVLELGEEKSVFVKEVKILNDKTGDYEPVKAKFPDQLTYVTKNAVSIREGGQRRSARLMLIGRKRKVEEEGNYNVDNDDGKEEIVPEHLEKSSMVTDGSGLRSTGGKKYKVSSDCKTQAANLDSHLEGIISQNYAENTNALLLAIKRSNWDLVHIFLEQEGIDVMHRDYDKASPLILTIKNHEKCYEESEETLPNLVENILLKMDEQISVLTKVHGKCKFKSTKDFLKQDRDGSKSGGKTALQLTEKFGLYDVFSVLVRWLGPQKIRRKRGFTGQEFQIVDDVLTVDGMELVRCGETTKEGVQKWKCQTWKCPAFVNTEAGELIAQHHPNMHCH